MSAPGPVPGPPPRSDVAPSVRTRASRVVMTVARAPVSAYVALGANLGDATAAVRRAAQALDSLPRTRLTRCSSLYRTAPVAAAGPDFINAVAELETALSAPELLRGLQRIEHEAGRERPCRNAPRTLDLDLLLYGEGRIDSRQLTVPHPRMRARAFVLVPLAELDSRWAPAARAPVLAGQAITRLAA